MKDERTVYQLTVEDIQNVSYELLGRKLTIKEIEKVENKLGDTVPWYNAIETAIFLSEIKRKRYDKTTNSHG
ncbi:MAG: hypothetical protein KKF20_00690 [Bacteroidetes bacterium]|nr:hypothetical protein [Bacteroidota bacterium]MBU1422718.1 hypothetical protein [Bacteroidota bacterium]MBU2470908.1 hypothetical protein [Bacteroidota bacterium]MBU2635502.1 hypothetical protein [Bacteroidota bacterium]